MKRFAIFLIIVAGVQSFLPRQAHAQVTIPMALTNTKMLTISGGTNLYSNVCSQALSTNLIHAGRLASPTSYIDVSTIASGSVAVYKDAACSIPYTGVTVYTWDNQAWYYVMTSAAGTSSVSSTANNYTSSRPYYLMTAASNPFVWTGGASSNVWTTGGNWSGGSQPGPSDVAYFDNSCTTFCSPQTPVGLNVEGIVMRSNFTGVITQPAGRTITLGSRGFRQAGGTFTGSSSGDAITISGPFDVSGGTFTSTSGTLSVDNTPFNVRGGVFNANNGTVALTGSWRTYDVLTYAATNFKNVNFDASGQNLLFGGTMSIAGNLYINDNSGYSAYFNGGLVDLKGNLTVAGYGRFSTNNQAVPGLIKLSGSSNQTVNTTSAIVPHVPGLQIASTGGTVTYSGNLRVTDKYQYTSGTISPGAGTLTLSQSWRSIAHAFGPEVYSAMVLEHTGANLDFSGTTAKVAGLTSLQNSYWTTFTNGTLEARGNVVVGATGLPGVRGAPGVLKIAGSTNQLIDVTANSITGVAPLGAVLIASTGGTVSFTGANLYWNGSWVYSSGNVNMGTTKISSWDFGTYTFTPGSAVQYYDVDLNNEWNNSTNVTTTLNARNVGLVSTSAQIVNFPGGGSSLIASGTLTVNSGNTLNMNGSTRTQGTLINNGTINP